MKHQGRVWSEKDVSFCASFKERLNMKNDDVSLNLKGKRRMWHA
jgi:hypothetical protein